MHGQRNIKTTVNKYCLSTRHEFLCGGCRIRAVILNTEAI